MGLDITISRVIIETNEEVKEVFIGRSAAKDYRIFTFIFNHFKHAFDDERIPLYHTVITDIYKDLKWWFDEGVLSNEGYFYRILKDLKECLEEEIKWLETVENKDSIGYIAVAVN